MPDREAIRQTLGEFLEAETGESYPDLKDTTSLREDLNLDSVDTVSLVLAIERHYRIRLTQDELQGIGTVGDFLNLLQTKITDVGPQSVAA